MRWTSAAALPLFLAACGQGDSGNVMAPSANALPPALVDLALGPDPASETANEAEPDNEVVPAEPTEAAERAAPQRTVNRVEPPPLDEPADASAEEEAAETNNAEE